MEGVNTRVSMLSLDPHLHQSSALQQNGQATLDASKCMFCFIFVLLPEQMGWLEYGLDNLLTKGREGVSLKKPLEI